MSSEPVQSLEPIQPVQPSPKMFFKSEAELPAPPPLSKVTNRVPIEVYGFPFTQEHVLLWADAHKIAPGKKDFIRFQIAYERIAGRLRPELRRETVIKYEFGGYRIAQCLVIGSNANQKDLDLAQNIDVINEVWKVLGEGHQPAWYLRMRI